MHDPNLQAARYAFSAGQESAKQGSALYLPQVTATAMTNYVDVHSVSTLNTRLPLSPLVGNASGTLYGFSVTLPQPIYNIAVTSGADQLNDQANLSGVPFRGATQTQSLRFAPSYF